MEYNHIVIVEDEEKIANIVRDYASKQFKKVSVIANGAEVIPFLRQLETEPEVMILDLMLPGKEGTLVCKELREEGFKVPVIMLTAKGEEADKLVGFESGADDYISKPFSPRELMARVNAVIRRYHIGNGENSVREIKYKNMLINTTTHEFTIDGEPIQVTPNEFGLLLVLMENPSKVFSRYELLQKVMGYEYEGYDRTIDTHIKNIRKKIFDHNPELNYIKTIYGVGYKFLPN